MQEVFGVTRVLAEGGDWGDLAELPPLVKC
jgi:hypothetical protein